MDNFDHDSLCLGWITFAEVVVLLLAPVLARCWRLKRREIIGVFFVLGPPKMRTYQPTLLNQRLGTNLRNARPPKVANNTFRAAKWGASQSKDAHLWIQALKMQKRPHHHCLFVFVVCLVRLVN
ncbi:hypothetical protein D3C77_527360 [compost metagenome]